MCDPPLWTASVEGRDGSHSLMLVPGERVDGTVVRHEPYGAFVDIGEQELAAFLLMPSSMGILAAPMKPCPRGCDDSRGLSGLRPTRWPQPRISIRPGHLAGIA